MYDTFIKSLDSIAKEIELPNYFVVFLVERVKIAYEQTNRRLKCLENASVITKLPEYKECSVCLAEISDIDESIMVKCKHIFHVDCVLKWCDRICKCPLCRTNL